MCVCVCTHVGLCIYGLAIFFFVFLFAITCVYMQQLLIAWEFITCPKILGTALKITINFCGHNRAHKVKIILR